jgi:superfamily II DNA or RNA helicase
MKAVLSNRIYMDCSSELQRDLDKELTYLIPSHNPNDPPQVICNLGIVRPGLISIPIGRKDLIPKNYEVVDKRISIPVDFPEFRFDLRRSQQDVWDEIEDNAIINAWVSWGKTFTGLAIAAKLGQKTLVVTHTVALRNQWAKEVEKVFGINASIIGSGNWDVSGPIVIGNTQTLYRNLNKLHKVFGTIILDEMHHVSSPTFNRIIDSNYCRYKIGLSGTIERKDGKHVVFRDYFGNKLFQPPKENYMVPSIHLVASEIRFQDGAKTPWANRVTALTNDEEYIHTVSMLAAAYAARGHKVLVVSDRVAFLKNCAKLTGDKAVCVTGEIAHEDREKLVDEILYGNKNVLYGTQSIFSEGISVDTLSCLILGTPVNNEPLLTQLIGRVIRKKEGKISPVIVDIHLKGNTARKQAANRSGYYIKQGYEMKYI